MLFPKHCQIFHGPKSINAQVLMTSSICFCICYQVPWKSMLLSKTCSWRKSLRNFSRNAKKMFDEECKNLLRERQLTYEKYFKISSPENWSGYSKLRSTLSSVVKKTKTIFLDLFHLSQIDKRPLEHCKQRKGSKSINQRCSFENFLET